MGFFTRTAMDMLMKTTHPEINRRQCWNQIGRAHV